MTSQPVGELVRAVFSPFPRDWGFLDRPVITLFFGVMHELVGRDPAGYFLAKCAVGATVAAALYVLTHGLIRRSPWAGVEGAAGRAWVAPALWAASPQVFLSMLWLCDLAVLAELCLVGAVLLHLLASRWDPWGAARAEREVGGESGGESGWGSGVGRVVAWLAIQAAVLAIGYVGFKTKSSVKVLPVILLAHAAWVHAVGAWRYAPVAGLLAAAAVPWASLAHAPLPEFAGAASAGGAQTPGYFWRPPDLAHAWRMLLELPVAGAEGGRVTAYSVVGAWFPWGWGAALAAVVGLLMRRQPVAGAQQAMHRRGEAGWAAVVVWLGLAGVTLLIYPEVPAGLRGRYLVGVLAPMAVLLAWAWASAPGWAGRIAGVLVLIHLMACFADTLDAKRRIGLTIALNDEVRRRAEAWDRDATFVYLLGQVDHGHWPSDRRNRYLTVPDGPAFEARKDLSEAQGRVYLIVDRAGPLHPRAELEFTVTTPQDAYHRLIGRAEGPVELRAVYRWKALP